jgi:hypothetical protein
VSLHDGESVAEEPFFPTDDFKRFAGNLERAFREAGDSGYNGGRGR